VSVTKAIGTIPKNDAASIYSKGLSVVKRGFPRGSLVFRMGFDEPKMIAPGKCANMNSPTLRKKELCIATPDKSCVVGHGVDDLYL
jgi:hypothetical protein